jgi:hypothetical protein
MGLLDFGTDAGEKLVMETGNEFFTQAVRASSALVGAVNDAAQKHDVDPNYLWFTLYRAPGSWKRLLDGKEEHGLEVASNLAIRGSFVPNYARFNMPDEAGEKRVNDAFKQLGKWAASDFKLSLMRKFGSELKDSAKELMKLHRKERLSERDARLHIWSILDSRVSSHPHWFDDHLTLWQILHKLFKK